MLNSAKKYFEYGFAVWLMPGPIKGRAAKMLKEKI